MRSILGRRIALLIAAAGVLTAIPRTLAQSYTVTPLGAFTAGDYVNVSAINSSGHVVGFEGSTAKTM